MDHPEVRAKIAALERDVKTALDTRATQQSVLLEMNRSVSRCTEALAFHEENLAVLRRAGVVSLAVWRKGSDQVRQLRAMIAQALSAQTGAQNALTITEKQLDSLQRQLVDCRRHLIALCNATATIYYHPMARRVEAEGGR
jgi:multidrug resistance efflux pump